MANIRFIPSYSRYLADSHVPLSGFDPKGPWQMMPNKGYRLLHLEPTGVDRLTVSPQNRFIWLLSRS